MLFRLGGGSILSSKEKKDPDEADTDCLPEKQEINLVVT